MMFELAYIENGQIIRGGIKATGRTVCKWIEEYMSEGCKEQLIALPANENSISVQEHRKEIVALYNPA